MHPVGRNVLVRLFKLEETRYGNLHLPDTARVRSNNGIAIRRGSRVSTINRGDWVLFSPRLATYTTYEDQKVALVDERACLATMATQEEVPLNVLVDSVGLFDLLSKQKDIQVKTFSSSPVSSEDVYDLKKAIAWADAAVCNCTPRVSVLYTIAELVNLPLCTSCNEQEILTWLRERMKVC